MSDWILAALRGCVFASMRLCVLAPFLPPCALAQREPVLKQVAVPHPYYWREMYVPQVTGGPSAATWSPDGRELVYSNQGTLWRQRLGSTEAVQLTDGPGYDHQPDWSPDGRRVIYVTYRTDALDLRLLDLASGDTATLLSNGAVNLEPRWSPDGRRIAWVSSAHEGRWHVYIGRVENGRLAGIERVTPDVESGLPRYYYSAWDHYLSPTWSPDGSELILISNRGRIWGTGGLWRMEARAGSPMRQLHYEETAWQARPDWSPDGKRVVYASYDGRQRHNLWLLPAEGGDRFALTYGDADHTAPRWSRDGSRIAFGSNETGNPSLHVVTIPGGAVQRVELHTRSYLTPRGRLRIAILDETGRPAPARVSVTGPDGRGWAPDGAWRHADDGFDRAERRFEVTYFHALGSAELTLPEARYTVEVTRGLEYRREVRQVPVRRDTEASERFALVRLVDLPARGWWSGDLHVHMNYGGAYRNTPARLRFQAESEDLHLVENLIVNKEQRIPDIAAFLGRPDPVSTPRTIVTHDEEYHTSWWGHTGHLGLTSHVVLPNYAGYVNTAAASLYPDNAAVADLTRAQGGVTGYVHPFDLPVDPERAASLTYALPVDVALGKVDYLEVVGFSDHLVTAEIWYRLLNTGFRIAAAAGTDAMANFASLRGPVGMNRVFVRAGPTLEYRAWLAALKAGRTFVTNGPLVGLTIASREPGDTLSLPAGPHALGVRVWLRSIVPVEKLEIVANGAVVADLRLAGDRTAADTTITLPVTRSGWYTLRAYSRKATHPVLDLFPFATTSPIYVTVDGLPIRSAEDARWFVRWIERIEAAAARHRGWNTDAERAEVLGRLAAARAVFLRRGDEAAP